MREKIYRTGSSAGKSDKFASMNRGHEPFFWMGGQLATGLISITHDPAEINEGFWAITTTFDGEFTGVKFKTVEKRDWDESYIPLKSNHWVSSHNETSYCDLVEHLRKEIARGNVYQVNACRLLTNQTDEPIIGLIAGFARRNPAEYLGYLRIPGLEIASASPETFLRRRGDLIKSSPIKGTRPLGLTGNFPLKDEAENVMIVDLMRNDLGRICIEDSIKVPALLKIEELPGLAHLVSDIEGTLKSNIHWQEIFTATLPPGSVSGAPKSSAIKLIKKYEAIDRGPYCGTFGWVDNTNADLAVAIRTFWSDGATVKFGTGAGITWGSDPKSEWEETELKAARLIAIANGELS